MPGSPQVGEEFAGYRLESEISRGGMSVVFLAQNWRLGNYVALKVLAPEFAHDATFRARFLNESRVAASLNHPNVVPIIDFDAYDGHLYIAMRYVAGADLGQMIARQVRLDPGTTVHLLGQAALALDAAHRRDLVHRDVKPANLLIERTSDDADPDHLYLADFGITKYVGRPSGLTVPGSVWGTARYFAPEQAQGLIAAGAADQYALGLVLYECLTGQVPFAKGSGGVPAAVAYVRGDLPRATRFRPELPPAIDQVFDRVFAMHPDERYPSCHAFMAAASEALRTPGRAPGAGRVPEFQPAPLPPAGFPDVSEPADLHRMATEDHVREPLPGSRAGDWAFFSADGNGDGDGRPRRRRRVRNTWVRKHMALLSVAGLVVLAAAGVGTWMHVAKSSKAKPQASFASRPAAASLLTGQLYSVLNQTSMYVPTGDLDLSACREPSPTDLECPHPSAAIKNVSFRTYPSLSELYLRYEQIISGLTGDEPFTEVEGKGTCGETAPAPPEPGAKPTDESTWNLVNNATTTYTANQMVQGVSMDAAMGRVFCTEKANGVEYIVWTQDFGNFLGYATGAAPHQQVYEWWHYVHHNINFPNQPAMPTSPPATASSPPATAASGTSPPATAATASSPPATAASGTSPP